MKRGLCTFIASVIFAAVLLPGSMAETGETMITVPFYSAGMWDVKWDFPYSDSYFLKSSEAFSRDLAKASMGLTASAFRHDSASTIPNQYETYLGAAGFTNLHAFGYDRPTSPHSLSGVIASREITDFTLIAAAPCGQGYEKEWGGNLHVGEGERHEGFNEGALILEKEIFSYIKEHQLTGKLKLWISGYSRSAAVANLAAADLIESGRFEDVYAYLYAVPRTTKIDHGYPNICNICGSYDPVTQIPLESWGFFRHGWDLYLPSAATDTDYAEKRARANEICMSVVNDVFRNDPEMDYQIHLILEFIGEMLPDSEAYCSKMQEKILGLWTEENPDQIFQILGSTFASMEDLNRRQEYSREVVIDYLLYLITSTAERAAESREQDTSWAPDQNLSSNLAREHLFYIYLSWIFSDLTDDQLFQGSFSTQRLSVFGDVDVEIWQDGIFLNGVDPEGNAITKTESMDGTVPDGKRKTVFAKRIGRETMVFLPANDDFQVRIVTDDPSGFSYRADACYLPSTFGTSNGYHLVGVTPGIYELDFRNYAREPDSLKAADGKILADVLREKEYSPTLAMQLQMESDSPLLTVSAALWVLGAVIVFLLACLMTAILHKAREKKHGSYSPWYVIIPHYLMLLLFVWLTILFTERLYTIAFPRIAFAAAGGLVLFLLSLRGLLRNRNFPNALITGMMLVLAAVNALVYQQSEIVGKNLPVNLLYCAVMAVLAVMAGATFRIGRNKKTESKDI